MVCFLYNSFGQYVISLYFNKLIPFTIKSVLSSSNQHTFYNSELIAVATCTSLSTLYVHLKHTNKCTTHIHSTHTLSTLTSKLPKRNSRSLALPFRGWLAVSVALAALVWSGVLVFVVVFMLVCIFHTFVSKKSSENSLNSFSSSRRQFSWIFVRWPFGSLGRFAHGCVASRCLSRICQ